MRQATWIGSVVGVLAAGVLGGCGLSADIARVKGYDALREGQYAQAQTYFEKCVKIDPTDWKSHYYLGRIGLDGLNDPPYARRHLEVCETLRKAQPESAISVMPGSAKTAVPFPSRHRIADALAESIYRQGLHAPLYNYLREQASQFGETDDYMRVGRYLGLIGDLDAAATAYQKAALIAKPTDPRPHLELADIFDKAGDRQAALTELRKAYFIDPTIKGLADNIRTHGLVPGPTIGIAPQREKPDIVRPHATVPQKPIYPSPKPGPEQPAGVEER